jgi:hypothetical protein
MVTKYIIDNVSGQTITGNLTINGDFVITGTTNIIKYKVYTALLTQSGVNSPITITSGDLTVGVTYLIKSGGTGGDFTNVGAPNNDANTSFVATGTTPNSWGTKSLEYDEGAPVVTVLENTIGNIWFVYDGVGQYRLSSEGLFTEGKSWCITAIVLYGENLWEGNMERADENRYRIFTSENAIPVDDLLANTPIEIRVYN